MRTFSRRPQSRALAVAAVAITWIAVATAAFAQQPLTPLHSFNGTDGFGPISGVVRGADGALYGTTSRGGSAGLGTVFRLDPATQEVTTLHEFTGADGSLPYSTLAFGIDGLLYGSTYAGGAADLGTLFRIGPDGQGFASLHSFDGTDGSKPDDLRLTQADDGAFYGATSEGGPGGGGTLFRFDDVEGVTTVHSFAGTGVGAGLVAGSDGNWYGTTYTSGAYGLGTVFRFDPITFELATLHEFSGADGANPVPGALIQGSDGNLYGTTQLGSYGKVYKLDPVTLELTTLHTFSAINDGRMPLGGVTEGADGYLYGTTVLGGQGYGMVYRVLPSSLAYEIVVPFSGPNGRSPSGSLLNTGDGALYGVTRLGGAFNAGTVYRVSFDTTAPTITDIAARPLLLRPSNNRMVPVTLTVAAADAEDPAPRCKIIGVTCNQPATQDWVITGDLTVDLRAQRSGRLPRIYTLTVGCTDASGNSSTGRVRVFVAR